MEKQNAESAQTEDEQLEQLIHRIQQHGDDAAMLAFLELFEEDMQQLARYMRMPREDAMQSLKLGMMELVNA